MTTIVKDHAAGLATIFAQYSAKVITSLDAAINDCALMVEAEAKRLFRGRNDQSIYNAPPRVDTGLLRASITHRLKKSKNKVTASVGTNVSYAKDVEYGTSGTMPHPYMRTALISNKAKIILRIRKAIHDTKP